jgi:hypothetical protein
MSFDVTTYGSFGDEKVTSTAKIGGLPLGASMELPDGRKYRHARLGGAAAVAGCLYEGITPVNANTVLGGGAIAIAPTAAAIGATTLNITVGGSAYSAATAAAYNDGYLVTASPTGAGVGYSYKILSMATATAASTYTINLYPNDAIKVALEAGTTKCSVIPNPYSAATITAADTTAVSGILGVACATAAASAYVWLQTKGIASVMADATTVIIGMPVVAASAVAGAVGVPPAAGSAATSIIKQTLPVGYALLGSGTSGNFIPVKLCIE